MAQEPTDHDIDGDIVSRVNSLLYLLGPRYPPVNDIDDISAEHFAVLYHQVTDQNIPGSDCIKSARDGARVVQSIVDSLADDIFGIPMDHITGAGIVTGNRRMISDLLEIFGSIMSYDTTEEEKSAGNTDDPITLDELSTPLREVLLSLQDEAEHLERAAMLQSTNRAAIYKAKDAYTQTTPTSVTSSTTSPVLWKDVLLKTSQQRISGIKRQSQSQTKPISRKSNKYLTQLYRPDKRVSTPKFDNRLSKSTSCLTGRATQRTTGPMARTFVSRTTSTSTPEVKMKRSVPLRNSKDLSKQAIFSTQDATHPQTSSFHMTSRLKRQRSPHVQIQRITVATNDNNELQLSDLLTDLRPRRTLRSSVSERRVSKPEIQRPMKKAIKPKHVISSKLRRKSSTGNTSSIHPNHHDAFMSSSKVSHHLNKDQVYYEKLMKLTDEVKSIRDRRQELNKQITQLQKENKSLLQLENLIVKEIKLTINIENRKRQPRGTCVL